jgi:predicted dehydrogenase
VEVPAAISIEGAWSLVNTAEKTQQHCMMLENVCYGEEELWVLNMVKDGTFGKLTYGEAAYIHDLLDPLFSDRHYKRYRLRNHRKRRGNIYPTHGLGPIAQYMDILRGDKFEYLISMSSPEASLSKKASEVAPGHEFHGIDDFAHGDMNMSLIKTYKGRLILVQHDVVTHRPYDRINAIAGTNGYHRGDRFPTKLSIKSINKHNWLTDSQYRDLRKRYNHPIWNRLREAANNKGGHGGKDFIQIYRLFDALNEGRPLDMDVYDAATWSAIGPVSAESVRQGGKPISFPDFTRGNWKQERELGVMKY